MNKKLFICGAIATTLLISACVKKEPPKEEDTQNAASVAAPAAQFESLPSVEQPTQNPSVEIPAHVDQQPEQSTQLNTTPAAQEAVQPSTPAHTTTTPAPVAAKPVESKPEPKPVEAKPAAEEKTETKPVKAPAAQPVAEKPQLNASKASGGKTEDDAVAAAIAAAAPAL